MALWATALIRQVAVREAEAGTRVVGEARVTGGIDSRSRNSDIEHDRVPLAVDITVPNRVVHTPLRAVSCCYVTIAVNAESLTGYDRPNFQR